MSVLDIEICPQDLQLLQTAMGSEPATRDALGITRPDALAHLALGALCRRILANGYQPRPLAVRQSQDGQGDDMITIQIRGRKQPA